MKDYQSLAGAAANIITLNSLTKLFAIPGLRLGFLTAAPTLCAQVKETLAPWSVNSLAQAVGAELVREEAYVEASRTYVARSCRSFTGSWVRCGPAGLSRGR